MMKRLKRLLLLLTLASTGCGSDQVPTYPVKGKLRFADGTVVRHGMIELTSANFETTATGRIDHDGSFVLGTYVPGDGAAVGKHDAIVIQMVMADGSFKHTVDHGRPVPRRYATYEFSPLEINIEAVEQNDIVVTLKK